MTPRDVSVIIPALNEATAIAAAIRSVQANGAGETIVCDGGSDDETVRIADGLGASVVHSDPGRGTQLATGARSARGAMLLFLHADNRLGDGSLDELCRIAGPRIADGGCWGGFQQRIESDGPLYRALEWGNAARIRLRGMPFGDQAIFVSRNLYDRVGGFRTLPLMEDVDLSRRLRKLRWPLLVDRRIVVDARRWKKRGIIRQTLRNWTIQAAHACGISEQRLADWYRR